MGTVVALISITQSMTGQTKANLQSYGANIVVTPRAKDVSLSYGGISAGGVSVGKQSLSQADAARIGTIASRADISVVAPQLVGAVTVKGRRALLLGVLPEQQFKLKRWWSVGSGHAPANDHELIAGSAAAKTLGLTMGDYVRIGGRRVMVTGVMRETGSQDDSLLIVDLGAAQQVLHEPGKLTLIEIAALYAGAPVDRIAGEIGAALPQAKVTAMQEAVKSRQQAVDQFRQLQLCHRRCRGRDRDPRRVHHHDGFGPRAHERDRRVPRDRVPRGPDHADGADRGGRRRLGRRRARLPAGMAITYIVLPLVAHSAEVAWAPLLGLAAVVLAVAIGGLASLYPALHAGKMDPTEALRAL